jgi:hypothetical protein
MRIIVGLLLTVQTQRSSRGANMRVRLKAVDRPDDGNSRQTLFF